MKQLSAALSLALLAVVGGCGDDDYPYGVGCRYDPAGCYGGPGGVCETHADCESGYCCTDASNCGGGMCTWHCSNDIDCPRDMGCEHHMCFYLCASDADCAVGQRCEHGHTVCEWP
jgi:hypothetical protein